jgi:hypothetical protein
MSTRVEHMHLLLHRHCISSLYDIAVSWRTLTRDGDAEKEDLTVGIATVLGAAGGDL